MIDPVVLRTKMSMLVVGYNDDHDRPYHDVSPSRYQKFRQWCRVQAAPQYL